MIRTDPKERLCPFYVESAMKGIIDKQRWIRENMAIRSSFFVRVGTSFEGCRFHFEDQSLAVAFLMFWGKR